MNTFIRQELNAMARERKIPYYYDLPIHELRVKLGLERRIVKLPTGNYKRAGLNEMARAKGVRGFAKMRKHELAEKLGIVLPEPKPRSGGKPKLSRPVEVPNLDGTTTTYPSMTKASQAMGRHAVVLYTLAKKGKVRIF